MCEESVAQAKLEQQRGISNPPKLTPYTEEEMMVRQLVFVDGWITPFFKAAAIIYPGAKGRLASIQECLNGCSKTAKRVSVRDGNELPMQVEARRSLTEEFGRGSRADHWSDEQWSARDGADEEDSGAASRAAGFSGV
jgi:hypothetical protein